MFPGFGFVGSVFPNLVWCGCCVLVFGGLWCCLVLVWLCDFLGFCFDVLSWFWVFRFDCFLDFWLLFGGLGFSAGCVGYCWYKIELGFVGFMNLRCLGWVCPLEFW